MPFDDEENLDQELSLLDIFDIFWRRKFLILLITILAALLSVLYAITRPITYKAVCRVMSSGGGGRSSALSGLGELAGLVGFSLGGGAGGGLTLTGVMKINSVADQIIDEYDLMTVYSTDMREAARSALLGGLDTAPFPEGGGITEVSYIHTSPDFAAEMVNAFVIAAQNKMQEISIEDAQRRKNFFEIQLAQAQRELTEAEDAMIAYQQSKGLLSFESQTSALLASVNSLKKQIADKNMEIASLKSYARRDNPKLKLAQSQLDALNEELHKLEEEQRNSGASISSAVFATEATRSSIGDLPELGIEYQRYVRDLRFATAKYESMFTQYESAKLSEVNDLSNIFILDPAEPPEIKYGPKRKRIVIIGTAAGFIFSVFLVFILAHIQALRKARQEQEEYEEY